jgi:exonuclease VII large subunit
MMKLFTPRTLILILLILSNTGISYSQDTTKKVVTQKPAVKYNPYATKYPKPAAAATQTPGAATSAPQAATDKSLRGQYQYLLTKVYNYQQPLVAALFKNYNDTLTITRRQLKEARATLSAQAQTIDTLKKSAAEKDQTLTQANARVDEVSLLGIPITKSTYNLIMWGLVIVFGAVAAIVIARSGSHSREAKYRVKLYNELEEEYKAYKTKANEKEKKLARELQTERNKLDELLGKG